MSSLSETDPAKPTRGRLVLGAWLCGLSGVLYLDRICMSQALPAIQEQLGLSNTQGSYVLMAFTLAYGICEIPTGLLGDRLGARLVITRIVLWWSAFTRLTGACTGLYSLLQVRFLFGAGEAGAFPNAARVIHTWFPPSERGRMQGFLFGSAQVGAVVAPALTAQIIERLGWHWAFVFFGLVGTVWAAGFWWWFRDDPANHPGVNPVELAIIHHGESRAEGPTPPIRWGQVLTNRGVLTLCVIMIMACFYSYFFYSWFPKYLRQGRGLDNIHAGNLASLVLAGSAAGVLGGGWLADRIARLSVDTRAAVTAQRRLAVVCYLVAAGLLYAGIRCEKPEMLAALWAASFMAMHITLPNWWVIASRQAGKNVGALCGLMNGIGVVGALASQWFVGAYADYQEKKGFTGRDQWDPMFDIYALVLVLTAAVWWTYRYTPLEEVGDEPGGIKNGLANSHPVDLATGDD